jgi:mannose-6-phosphate isomerase-like protein (cupin superfamily)
MALNFPPATVHITTNSPDGKSATFLPPMEHPSMPLGPTHQVTYVYATPPSPFDSNTSSDIEFYTEKSAIKPISAFPQEGASGAVIMDFAPALEGQGPFIHKTNTVDYVIVLEGTVELELGGGEKKLLKKGEVVIQRNVWHSCMCFKYCFDAF